MCRAGGREGWGGPPLLRAVVPGARASVKRARAGGRQRRYNNAAGEEGGGGRLCARRGPWSSARKGAHCLRPNGVSALVGGRG